MNWIKRSHESSRIPPTSDRASPVWGWIAGVHKWFSVLAVCVCALGGGPFFESSAAHAQTRLSTEKGVRVERQADPSWVTKQFFVVGIDVRDGHTRWISPQFPAEDESFGIAPHSTMNLEELLLAGYWVQAVSSACQGNEAVLILRQP